MARSNTLPVRWQVDQLRRSWLDRAIGFLSPQTGLRRIRARTAAEILIRHYEGAASGRRTQGWNRSLADANAAMGPSLSALRAAARDLVRNNGHAESAITTICDEVPSQVPPGTRKTPCRGGISIWREWAGTTA